MGSQNNIPDTFVKENGTAGCPSVEGILRRNPMIASRKVQYLDPGRAQKLSRFTVNNYCAKLKITMEEPRVMKKNTVHLKSKWKRV